MEKIAGERQAGRAAKKAGGTCIRCLEAMGMTVHNNNHHCLCDSPGPHREDRAGPRLGLSDCPPHVRIQREGQEGR